MYPWLQTANRARHRRALCLRRLLRAPRRSLPPRLFPRGAVRSLSALHRSHVDLRLRLPPYYTRPRRARASVACRSASSSSGAAGLLRFVWAAPHPRRRHSQLKARQLSMRERTWCLPFAARLRCLLRRLASSRPSSARTCARKEQSSSSRCPRAQQPLLSRRRRALRSARMQLVSSSSGSGSSSPSLHACARPPSALPVRAAWRPLRARGERLQAAAATSLSRPGRTRRALSRRCRRRRHRRGTVFKATPWLVRAPARHQQQRAPRLCWRPQRRRRSARRRPRIPRDQRGSTSSRSRHCRSSALRRAARRRLLRSACCALGRSPRGCAQCRALG